jgi:hypothetical protein
MLQAFSFRVKFPATRRNPVIQSMLQVFAIQYKEPWTKETEISYVIFKYSHFGSNHLSIKENSDMLWYLQ